MQDYTDTRNNIYNNNMHDSKLSDFSLFNVPLVERKFKSNFPIKKPQECLAADQYNG